MLCSYALHFKLKQLIIGRNKNIKLIKSECSKEKSDKIADKAQQVFIGRASEMFILIFSINF